MLDTIYQWHVAAFSSGMSQILAVACGIFPHRRPGSGRLCSIDARQARRILRAAVSDRTASREEIPAHDAPVGSPRIIRNRLLAAGLR